MGERNLASELKHNIHDILILEGTQIENKAALLVPYFNHNQD